MSNKAEYLSIIRGADLVLEELCITTYSSNHQSCEGCPFDGPGNSCPRIPLAKKLVELSDDIFNSQQKQDLL